jgi:ribosomal protein S18 acetylase RimI-like enzyme
VNPPPKKASPKTNAPAAAAVVPLRHEPVRVQLPPRVAIRPVREYEIDEALALFLADPGQTCQVRRKVKSFRALAQQEHYDLTRQVIVVHDQKPLHACLFVPNEGRSAFVFTSCPSSAEPEPPEWTQAREDALQQLCRWAFDSGSTLLQILLEPGDTLRRELCLRCGFRALTDLVYLFRLSDSPLPAPEPSVGIRWLSYQPQHHELFKSVIAQTYRYSLDCPELENLRDLEDIVLGHKAAGQFHPDLWNLLLLRDEPLGVLLLAPMKSGDTMELTYMGLCPAARRRGLGSVLLSQALALTGSFNIKSLTLAVDYRNQPACRLYRRFGFTVFLRRSVLIFSSHWL